MSFSLTETVRKGLLGVVVFGGGEVSYITHVERGGLESVVLRM